MTFRPGGTPLGSLFSTSAPSLEAANHSQITDLIQRNRTLDHTNRKLSEQLAEEVNKSKTFVQEIQDKHEVNQRQWKESCEEVVTSYRIIQKLLGVELEKEKSATLAEMGIARAEKLQRVHRDYKLSLFQMHAEDLERTLEKVEEDKYHLQEQREAVTRRWTDECVKYATKLRDTQDVLKRSEKELKDTESKLNRLREIHANLDAEKETFTSKLTRSQLSLGHEQDKNKDLTKELNDAKRRIKELSRQVDEWQKLESSEGNEMESQRKKRMILEQKMEELTEKHEREMERIQASVEKEKERGAKMKEARDDLEVEAKNNKKEAEKANILVKKLEKKLEKLKGELEVERSRVRPASPVKTGASTPISIDSEIEEVPNDETIAQRPKSTRVATVKAGLSNKFAEKESAPSEPRVARKHTSRRPKKPKMDSDVEEILDDKSEAPRTRKGKAKADQIITVADEEEEVEVSNTKNEEAKADESHSVEDEEVVKAPRTRKGKAMAEEPTPEGEPVIVEKPKSKKRKALSDQEDHSPVEIKGGRRAVSRARSVAAGGVSRARSKPPISKQPSVKPITEEEAEAEDNDGHAPKKKRKINIFPTNADATSVLANFGTGGLDIIPAFLSPLKQDEPVPQRSLSIVGSLSNFVKFPFQR